MKVVCISDTHCRHTGIKIPGGDLLVHAGDFSNQGSLVEVEGFLRWFSRLPHKHKVLIAGNHDWLFEEEPQCVPTLVPADIAYLGINGDWLQRLSGTNNIIAADGQSVSFQGLEIAVVGWLQRPEWPRSTDIVVAHAPPAACWCASEEYGSRDLGDSDLRAAINRHPTALLVLSGHVHEPRRRWSRMPGNGSLVLVPGCDPTAEQPWHWAIDTTSGCASWTGHPDDPVETISLFPEAAP